MGEKLQFTELDQYLFGQGTHYDIYRKLGAHPTIQRRKKGFSATYKGESTAPNGKAAYDVELTPKKKGDIVKVELQIEKYSNFPARITVTSKNGVSSTIQISQLKTGINQPDRFFVFNEEDYPDVEVIDLR